MKPLTKAISFLAGTPEEIQSQVEELLNEAQRLRDVAENLEIAAEKIRDASGGIMVTQELLEKIKNDK
jgi:prefoldin subunit 5